MPMTSLKQLCSAPGRMVCAPLLCALLFISPLCTAADSPRGGSETLWASGDEFVKLVPQDALPGAPAPPNQHPVAIQPDELAAALAKITFRRDDESIPLMDKKVAARLASHLAEALGKASPGQDVLFAVLMWVKAQIVGTNDVTVAARAFYFGGKLHLIVGDLHRSAVAPEFARSPIAERKIDRRMHPHEPGMRARETRHEGVHFDAVPGIRLFAQNGRTREDWLVVDIAALATPPARAQSEGERAPATEKATTAEERLRRLKRLHDQGLITDEEYARKRKEIIDQL